MTEGIEHDAQLGGWSRRGRPGSPLGVGCAGLVPAITALQVPPQLGPRLEPRRCPDAIRTWRDARLIRASETVRVAVEIDPDVAATADRARPRIGPAHRRQAIGQPRDAFRELHCVAGIVHDEADVPGGRRRFCHKGRQRCLQLRLPFGHVQILGPHRSVPTWSKGSSPPVGLLRHS